MRPRSSAPTGHLSHGVVAVLPTPRTLRLCRKVRLWSCSAHCPRTLHRRRRSAAEVVFADETPVGQRILEQAALSAVGKRRVCVARAVADAGDYNAKPSVSARCRRGTIRRVDGCCRDSRAVSAACSTAVLQRVGPGIKRTSAHSGGAPAAETGHRLPCPHTTACVRAQRCGGANGGRG